MQIAHPDAQISQVFGQAFRHALGQRGHQHPLALFDGLVNFAHQIVHLTGGGTQQDQRIQQARRADDLLHRVFAEGKLIFAGRGADVDDLIEPLVKFVEQQRPVIVGGGQTEAVVH